LVDTTGAAHWGCVFTATTSPAIRFEKHLLYLVSK
jgi:hypothetical protein